MQKRAICVVLPIPLHCTISTEETDIIVKCYIYKAIFVPIAYGLIISRNAGISFVSQLLHDLVHLPSHLKLISQLLAEWGKTPSG